MQEKGLMTARYSNKRYENYQKSSLPVLDFQQLNLIKVINGEVLNLKLVVN